MNRFFFFTGNKLQFVDRIVGGRGHPASLIHRFTNDPTVNALHNLRLLFDLDLSLTNIAAISFSLQQGKHIYASDGQFLFLAPELIFDPNVRSDFDGR